jgi:hypothetical protein
MQKEEKKEEKKQLQHNMVLSLVIGIHIKDRFSILSCLSIYYSSAYGKPTSKGLVCFTRSGFHVTDSYSIGNTLQREMDGSNAYYNSSVLMRSGFHIIDSYLGNTSQSDMDDYQTRSTLEKISLFLEMYCFI